MNAGGDNPCGWSNRCYSGRRNTMWMNDSPFYSIILDEAKRVFSLEITWNVHKFPCSPICFCITNTIPYQAHSNTWRSISFKNGYCQSTLLATWSENNWSWSVHGNLFLVFNSPDHQWQAAHRQRTRQVIRTQKLSVLTWWSPWNLQTVWAVMPWQTLVLVLMRTADVDEELSCRDHRYCTIKIR